MEAGVPIHVLASTGLMKGALGPTTSRIANDFSDHNDIIESISPSLRRVLDSSIICYAEICHHEEWFRLVLNNGDIIICCL